MQTIIRTKSCNKIITKTWDNSKCFFNNRLKAARVGLIAAIVNDNLFQTGGNLQINSTRDLGHRCCSLTPSPLVLDAEHERPKSTTILLRNDLNTTTLSE